MAALTEAAFRAAIAPHLTMDVALAWGREPGGDALGAMPEPDGALIDAAVLMGLVPRDGHPHLILTTRTDTLRAHAGQVALPGGKIDADDAGPLATALRESQEEIGLDPGHVTPLGLFRPYVTRSGYRIMPVIALVDPGHELAVNPREVVDAFEVPLAFLADPANHRIGSREWKGAIRHYYEMPYTDLSGKHRYIWGVTAGIIRLVTERLADPWPG